MNKWIEVSVRTVEAAKELALDRLGVAEDELEFEIIAEPRARLLRHQKAKIRARYKPKGKSDKKRVTQLRAAARRPARPKPRLIREWKDAEQAACEWMCWMGFTDAALTPPGADGGVDVLAASAVAQVKDWGAQIPIAEVQRMAGVAAELKRTTALMFARAGFTQQAIDSADRLGIALFTFDLSGEPNPINAAASKLMAV